MLNPDRRNSFDALRLLAAWLVILGHGFILSGSSERLPLVGGMDVSVIGVSIFFSISGFLIWKSWASANTWHDFVSARVLRIFPALVLVVVLTTFLLGPLVSELSPEAYFSSSGTYQYLINAVIFDPQYLLPGVFENLPVTDAVNGSLWTLRAEMLCYIAVPLAAILPRKIQPTVLLLAALFLIAIGTNTELQVAGANFSVASVYWGFFAMGSFLASIKFSGRAGFLIASVSIILWAVSSFSKIPALQVLACMSFAVAVIAVGLMDIPGIRHVAHFGDFSYGMYLVAFPVQQSLLVIMPGQPPLLYVLIVTVISLFLGWGIWHLVEARAMRQKHKLSTWLRRRTASTL